jgi:signal transduction histidine kinase
MKKLVSLIDELRHNPNSRYMRLLLFGGYGSVLIIMAISMLVTLKYGSDIAELGTDILGSRYPYSIELLELKQEINKSTQLVLNYRKDNSKKNQNTYLENHELILEKSSIFDSLLIAKMNQPSVIRNKLDRINALNNQLVNSEKTSANVAKKTEEINFIYAEISSDIGNIINQLMKSSQSDGELLDKRLNQIIDFNIGIMLTALIIGFFVVILITKNIVNLLNEVNSSKKQLEASKNSAEQKANELTRTSRVLVKTNKNLSNSLEKLNSTQDQLVQNEKMASLGGLVAGIAHEINTPIGIGVTASSHLEDNIKQFETRFVTGDLKKSEMCEFIETSKEASHILLQNLERAAKLIQSFKQVAVDQTSEEVRHFNLKEYVQGIILSLQPKLKKTRIDIELICPENLELNSHPGAYSQIFTNLIINSLIHAYDENQQGQININITEKKSNIHVMYCDDGKGIPEEHLSALFDPFFTTRRGQGGSGLGLHLVYNIITQQLYGDINISNKSSGGSCFEINIPNHKTV